MTYKLTWVPNVLRAAGLKVIEIDGWQTRGHGDMGDVRMLLCHHTAEKIDSDTKPVLQVLTHGRPAGPGVKELKGPLCQLALGQDGIFYMIAAGLAYHAGAGSWQGITTGNSSAIGIEAENNGLGEPWPPLQVDCFARGSAAMLKHLGQPPIMCAGHKEYALPPGRKIDPSFDMVDFRKRVEAFMVAPVITMAVKPVAPAAELAGITAMRDAARLLLLAADELEKLRAKP